MTSRDEVYKYLYRLGSEVQEGKSLGDKDTQIVLSLLEVSLAEYDANNDSLGFSSKELYNQLLAVTKW